MNLNPFGAIHIIESVYCVEDGFAWLPAGRSGWKVKRAVKVPMRGGIRVGANTMVMHPATVAELQRAMQEQPR